MPTAAKKPRPKKAAQATKPKRATRPKAKPKSRADLGAPIDGFFGKQPPQLRAILEVLRGLVEKAAPDAESSIKWGMPFYTLNGEMMCALGAHKAHVNLILAGPPGTFSDPKQLLSGEGKTGRHLKLTSADDIPIPSVRAWLKAAAEAARGAAG